MAEPSLLDLWIRRTATVLAVLFLALLCFLVWRLAMLTARVERTVADLSGDMRQVTGTAARIAEKIDRLNEQVDRLEKKAREAVPVEEVESLLDSAAALRESAENPLTPAAEAEIRQLLARLRDPALTFGYGGEDIPAGRFYLQIYAKYKAYRRTLASAEDFIARIATRTIDGRDYHVRRGEGEQRPLGEWLREELAKLRAEAQPAAPENE